MHSEVMTVSFVSALEGPKDSALPYTVAQSPSAQPHRPRCDRAEQSAGYTRLEC